MAQVGEDVLNAVQLAVRRAIVRAEIRRALAGASNAGRALDVPEALIAPVIAGIAQKYESRILAVAGTSGDAELDELAEQLITHLPNLEARGIHPIQMLEVYDRMRQALAEDSVLRALRERVQDKAIDKLFAFYGQNADLLETAIKKLEQQVADIKREFTARAAMEDVTALSGALLAPRYIPVRAYVEADIVPEARVNRAISRVLEASGFEGSSGE